jgi:2'-5' RNA ligase superfamily
MLARQSEMKGCGPNAIVAYWLIPAEPMRSFFASTIAELAARFDAPLFEPHVTIYTTGQGADIPAEVLSRALVDSKPIRLSVRNVQYSDELTKTVFVQFEPSPPLPQLSRTLQRASALQEKYQLNPHLSLIYKKMTRSAKIEVAASVSPPFTEVLFDSVKAVICPARIESRQDVEAWRVAAVQRSTE